jgi:hypothetical protein
VFVFTVGVVNPSSADGGLPCTYAANPTPPLIASGLLDIALRDEYDALYLLGNRSVPQKVGPESAFVAIESATVRITSSTGSPLASYTRFVAASLRPTSDCRLGQDLLGPVTIVDANTISKDPEVQNLLAPPLWQSGRARVLTYVSFFGHTLDGRTAASNEFVFPVDACNGCLIQFRNDPNYPIPNCTGTAPTQLPDPCEFGEDVQIDCKTCSDVAGCQGLLGPTDGGPIDQVSD